jgi:hypothetical protein
MPDSASQPAAAPMRRKITQFIMFFMQKKNLEEMGMTVMSRLSGWPWPTGHM